MRHDEISDALNYLDDEIIEETNKVRQNPKGTRKLSFMASSGRWSLIACFTIICIVGISFGAFKLGNTENKSAKYDNAINESATETRKDSTADESANPDAGNYEQYASGESSSDKPKQDSNVSESLTQTLTEEELFHEENTVIFKGVITTLSDVFASGETSGQTEKVEVASIRITKSYRGSCKDGEIVEILLPHRSTGTTWVEDTEIVSAIDIGITGIFMVQPYEDEKIADYYLLDGQRYAFLETDDGLIFDRTTYSSIANAATFDEIESYIMKMIDK